MTTDNYSAVTSLTGYYRSRTERTPARHWANEKLLHDLAAIGYASFFEGTGTNPMALTGASTSKLWLDTTAGVTGSAGTIKRYKGTGDPTVAANWIVNDLAGTFGHLGNLSPVTTSEDFATRSAAAAATISSGITYLRTAGYAAVGDGGHALYLKVGSTGNGVFQSVDGAYWAPVMPESGAISAIVFGAEASASVNHTAALQAAVDFVEDNSGGIVDLDVGIYYLAELVLKSNVALRGVKNATIIMPHASLALTGTCIANETTEIVNAGDRVDANIGLLDIIFDGTGRVYATYPAAGYNTIGSMVYFTNVDAPYVNGCTFRDHQSFSLVFQGCRNAIVDGMLATNTGKNDYSSPAVAFLNLGTTYAVVAATQANPCVLTFNRAHGFSTGNSIYVKNVEGLSGLVPDGLYTVGATTGTTVALSGINTSAARPFLFTGRERVGPPFFTENEGAEVRNSTFRDLNRAALQMSGFANLISNVKIERVGEAGIFINYAQDTEIEDFYIDGVVLTDIVASGIERNYCANVNARRGTIKNTETVALVCDGTIGCVNDHIKIVNPGCLAIGTVYQTKPFAVAGGLAGATIPDYMRYVVFNAPVAGYLTRSDTYTNIEVIESNRPVRARGFFYGTVSGSPSTDVASLIKIEDNDLSQFGQSVGIIAATLASPCVVTTDSAHGFITGDEVYITGVVNPSALTGGPLVATVLSSTTFSVPIDTSAGVAFPVGGNQLARVGLISAADMISLSDTSYVQQRMSVKGNIGHPSESPKVLRQTIVSTGDTTFTCYFPPSKVEFFAEITGSAVHRRYGQGVVYRPDYGQSFNRLYVGHGFARAIDDLNLSPADTEAENYGQHTATQAAIRLIDADSNTIFNATMLWNVNGIVLNVGVVSIATAITVVCHP